MMPWVAWPTPLRRVFLLAASKSDIPGEEIAERIREIARWFEWPIEMGLTGQAIANVCVKVKDEFKL